MVGILVHARDNAPLSRRQLISIAGTTYWTAYGSASNSGCCRGRIVPFALVFMASAGQQKAAMARRAVRDYAGAAAGDAAGSACWESVFSTIGRLRDPQWSGGVSWRRSNYMRHCTQESQLAHIFVVRA